MFLEKKIYKNLERKNVLKNGEFTGSTLTNDFELL